MYSTVVFQVVSQKENPPNCFGMNHSNITFRCFKGFLKRLYTISLSFLPPLRIKIPNFLCGHRKGHSPFLTPIGSVYTLHFFITSAHTLLCPFIIMLRLVDHTLCLDQLYSCTVIMLSRPCTPVRHFVVTSAHTLLRPVCCLT